MTEGTVAESDAAEPAVAEPTVAEPAVAEPTDGEAQAPARSRRSRATTGLAAASAVLLLALVALLVLTALSLGKASDAKNEQAAARDATNAATKDVPIFGSYGYATIDADQKAAESVFVPKLRANYEKLIAPRLQTLKQKKVIVKVVVQQAQAVQVINSNNVQVLTFFIQTTTSPTSTSPNVVPSAYAISMQKINGAWLVAAVNPAS